MSVIIPGLRRLLVWATASLLLSTLVPGISPHVPASAATSASCKIRPWTPKTDHGVFVFPATANKARQDDFVDMVVMAINATPRGAILRVSAHGSSDVEVQRALLCAIERKVEVRYITWHKDYARDGRKYITQLRSLLGPYGSNNRKSYLQMCKGACNTAGSGSIHHAKIITISVVVGANRRRYTQLVFTGSSNLTPNSSSRSWQHNQLVVGRSKYYRAFRSYFDAMRVDENHFYPSTPVTDGNLSIYFYPSRKPVNPQLELLRDISSCKAKKGSGVHGKTRIVFMAFSWRTSKRDKVPQAIADKLGRLRRDGCVVQVALTADKVDRSIIRTLKKWRVETINTRRFRQFNHTKGLAVSGTVNGKAVNALVSGTLNPVPWAMHKSDEYLVKTTGIRSVVLEAFRFYNSMKTNGKRL